MPGIDRETVAYLARLARLELEEAELARLERDLAQILAYVERLTELDLEDEEPTAHPFVRGMPLRADEPGRRADPEVLLELAPDRSERSYRVPPILGGG